MPRKCPVALLLASITTSLARYSNGEPVHATVNAPSANARSSCDAPFAIDSSGMIIDACGRQRWFRGLNSVIKSPPYYAAPSSYAPGGGSLTPTDATLWASLGLNLVRLGMMWAGVMPAPGVVNTTYLDVMTGISASLLQQAGIYTLVDAHQDVFSSRFCEDGAPAWVADKYAQGSHPFPLPLQNMSYPIDNSTGNPYAQDCGKQAWGDYYATYAAGRAFQTLYSSTQPEFTAFWTAVVHAYGASPGAASAVLGWEVLNEPWAGDALADPLLMIPGVADRVNLQPFYGNATMAIRAAEGGSSSSSGGGTEGATGAAGSTFGPASAEASAGAAVAPSTAPSPHKLIFYEPVTWDNFVPVGFTELPQAAQGLAALSYHYYSLPDVIGAAWQIAARAEDASRLSAGALLTEFDVDLSSPVNAPYSALDLRGTLDACDAARHGYIGWDYGALWQGDSLTLPTIRELARPFPFALAGTNASWSFKVDNTTGPRFSLSYTHNGGLGAGATSEVFLSTGLWFTGSSSAAAAGDHSSLRPSSTEHGGSTSPRGAPSPTSSSTSHVPSSTSSSSSSSTTSGGGMSVTVDSEPQGAVTWSLQHVNGAVIPWDAGMGSNGSGAGCDAPLPCVPATPFAYALLVIEAAPGFSGNCSVTVNVHV